MTNKTVLMDIIENTTHTISLGIKLSIDKSSNYDKLEKKWEFCNLSKWLI